MCGARGGREDTFGGGKPVLLRVDADVGVIAIVEVSSAGIGITTPLSEVLSSECVSFLRRPRVAYRTHDKSRSHGVTGGMSIHAMYICGIEATKGTI
jgi:hypothetical protein